MVTLWRCQNAGASAVQRTPASRRKVVPALRCATPSSSSGSLRVAVAAPEEDEVLDTHSVAQYIAQQLQLQLQPEALVSSFQARRAAAKAAQQQHDQQQPAFIRAGFKSSVSPASARPAAETPVTRHQLQGNLDLLSSLYTPPVLRNLLQRLHPDVLSQDLPAWHLFFQGLGCSHEQFYQLLVYSPESILDNTPFRAGRAIVFLKALGVSQEEIVSRIVPCYPRLLSTDEGQLQEAAEQLASPGLLEGPEATERLLLQCPGYLIPSMTAQLLPVLDCIRASRSGKYSQSGSYHI